MTLIRSTPPDVSGVDPGLVDSVSTGRGRRVFRTPAVGATAFATESAVEVWVRRRAPSLLIFFCRHRLVCNCVIVALACKTFPRKLEVSAHGGTIEREAQTCVHYKQLRDSRMRSRSRR